MKNLSDEERSLLIPPRTFLLGYTGSVSHGTYRPSTEPDVIDDKDILGVCFGPRDVYLGLGSFEQRRKQYGEWDSVVYEIRKMFRMWLGCNPNVFPLLWLEPHFYIIADDKGKTVLSKRSIFSSSQAFHSYSGYAYGELKAIEKSKNQFKGYMGEKRKRIVEKFGYDTYHCAHVVRLLRMGIEFLTTGELTVLRPDAPQLVSIKRGEWTLEQIKAEAARLFPLMEEAFVRTKLPPQPDREAAEKLLCDLVGDYICL